MINEKTIMFFSQEQQRICEQNDTTILLYSSLFLRESSTIVLNSRNNRSQNYFWIEPETLRSSLFDEQRKTWGLGFDSKNYLRNEENIREKQLPFGNGDQNIGDSLYYWRVKIF